MSDVKFLRRFNLIVFSMLLTMGIGVFFFLPGRLDDYIRFAGTVQIVLIPLVVAGAVGSTAKKLVEGNGKSKEKSDTRGIIE